MSDGFRTIGLYLTPEIVDEIDAFLYAEAGVKDVRSYFERGGSVPAGDPGAEVMAEFMREITEGFDGLYDRADWGYARNVDPDGFELVTVAADPEVVYDFREKVESARTIKECDSRTVHTAIFKVAADHGMFDSEMY